MANLQMSLFNGRSKLIFFLGICGVVIYLSFRFGFPLRSLREKSQKRVSPFLMLEELQVQETFEESISLPDKAT
ncbi:hypothetical protein GAYE_SCF48G5955 [Galdieria yellowstonensis]|uniref:Uncharacterized protein n=1 Tax=Galdieria yellowstonensis TaxID=3028027 RepID=A0AAV9ILS0_9RHOD|nr:hypothetical protein GAYE_SCF48G5955 [Galdieria yellowstonensis]